MSSTSREGSLAGGISSSSTAAVRGSRAMECRERLPTAVLVPVHRGASVAEYREARVTVGRWASDRPGEAHEEESRPAAVAASARRLLVHLGVAAAAHSPAVDWATDSVPRSPTAPGTRPAGSAALQRVMERSVREFDIVESTLCAGDRTRSACARLPARWGRGERRHRRPGLHHTRRQQ